MTTLRLMRVTGCGRARSPSVSGAAFGSGSGCRCRPWSVIAWTSSRQTASVRTMRTTRCGAVPRRSSAARQAVDDVGGAAHAVVDEGRLGVGANDEQRRRFALGQARTRELDVDLGAVVEHAQRPPRCIALDAVAELELLDVDAGVNNGACGDVGLGTLLLERQQLGGRIGSTDTDAM